MDWAFRYCPLFVPFDPQIYRIVPLRGVFRPIRELFRPIRAYIQGTNINKVDFITVCPLYMGGG